MKKSKYTYYIFLISVCLFLGWTKHANAQFFVKKGTEVTIKKTLTSKEDINIIQSSFKGNGTFVLDSKKEEKQYLSVEDDVDFYNLKIENADAIEIKSPITMLGNLEVVDGVLKLNYTVGIKGLLKMTNKASVIGLEFVYLYKDNLYHSGFNAVTQLVKNINASTQNSNTITGLKIEYLTNKLKIYKPTLHVKKLCDQLPLTPPPKYVEYTFANTIT